MLYNSPYKIWNTSEFGSHSSTEKVHQQCIYGKPGLRVTNSAKTGELIIVSEKIKCLFRISGKTDIKGDYETTINI
jgi:hypothetical protein